MESTQGGGAHLPELAPLATAGARSQDKGKRDEWSEGGVLSLLEVYEAKWLLRNRAKLKGSDWEDIAHQVSARSLGNKSLKTPNQCKNKIESMKKRYRAEAAAASKHPCVSSSWQFYAQMDSLLKGLPNCSKPKSDNNLNLLPKVETELEVEGQVQCSHHDDGSNTMHMDLNADNVNNNEKEDGGGTDSNKSSGKPAKRRKGVGHEVAESIRLLADSILKIEEARMEMCKDSERIRAEVEIKKGEMELKRTEIVAKTQLQIAKLFVRRSQKKRDKSETSSEGVDAQTRSNGMED